MADRAVRPFVVAVVAWGLSGGFGESVALAQATRPSVRAPDDAAPAEGAPEPTLPAVMNVDELAKPGNATPMIKLLAMLTLLSLAPALLIMTTCFIRFVIVFGLLRQALGTQQLPPNQVLISLSLFLSFFVMAPTWWQAYERGIKPYENSDGGEVARERAFENTTLPLRDFMVTQIDATGNADTVLTLMDYHVLRGGEDVEGELNARTIPLQVLLPAYMLSELKTAFIIGFQLYLPFLVIDMVVASILISMGMMMLPPVLVSLPFKLLLFVLIDGWHLVVGMLLESVVVPGSG